MNGFRSVELFIGHFYDRGWAGTGNRGTVKCIPDIGKFEKNGWLLVNCAVVKYDEMGFLKGNE